MSLCPFIFFSPCFCNTWCICNTWWLQSWQSWYMYTVCFNSLFFCFFSLFSTLHPSFHPLPFWGFGLKESSCPNYNAFGILSPQWPIFMSFLVMQVPSSHHPCVKTCCARCMTSYDRDLPPSSWAFFCAPLWKHFCMPIYRQLKYLFLQLFHFKVTTLKISSKIFYYQKSVFLSNIDHSILGGIPIWMGWHRIVGIPFTGTDGGYRMLLGRKYIILTINRNYVLLEI